LELRISNWASAPGAPDLGTLQARLDSTGYSSGSGDPLGPLGGCCPGDPAAAFIDADHPNYVFAGLNTIEATDIHVLDYAWGATLLPPDCRVDGGGIYYAGTLIVDVPTGAGGTYSLGFIAATTDTFINDCSGFIIPDLTLTPGLITVSAAATGACCDDGECVGTMGQASCEAAGGTWFEGEECPGYSCPTPPTGACCVDGDCVGTMTESSCAARVIPAPAHRPVRAVSTAPVWGR
jgi:hypothetical protein